MKKIITSAFLLLLLTPNTTKAADTPCTAFNINISNLPDIVDYEYRTEYPITLSGLGLVRGQKYTLAARDTADRDIGYAQTLSQTYDGSTPMTFTLTERRVLEPVFNTNLFRTTMEVHLFKGSSGIDPFCVVGEYEVYPTKDSLESIYYTQDGIIAPACLLANSPITQVIVKGMRNNNVLIDGMEVELKIIRPGAARNVFAEADAVSGDATFEIDESFEAGTYRLIVQRETDNIHEDYLLISDYCDPEDRLPWSDDGIPIGGSSPPAFFNVCDNVPDEDNGKDECIACLTRANSEYVWTAIGCLPTSIEGFTKSILTLAVSIGGGIALLMILYGAFIIATSAGNPEQTQKGKEAIGGAMAGLLFIIFSVVMLNFIGVEIIKIPGL